MTTQHPERGVGGPLLMGVVNVTPDSFSDGGKYVDPDAAIAHGLELLADGAAIVDVGGESTRPGARRPSVAEELARVIPVVSELSRHGTVSIDTMRAEVAEQAIAAGAGIVNDVSGGLADPDILRVAASSDVTYVAMHWRGHADVMPDLATYDGDVVSIGKRELRERIEAATAAGIQKLVVDPGLGFAKTGAHNWEILRRIDELHELGLPVLVGASRKSFLGRLLHERPVEDREAATVALTCHLSRRHVWAIRVHDVRASADALAVTEQLEEVR
jgi:dihydropteroate synthase